MRYVTLTTLILIVLAVGCSSDETTGPLEPTPLRPLTETEKTVTRNNVDFAFSLFRQTQAAESDANVFLSPLSVAMALGMTLNGANGATRTAMEEALELQGLSRQEINEAFKGLKDLLEEADPRVTLRIANSIWGRDGFAILQDFIDINKQYFEAEVQSLDFNDEQSVGVINGWVSTATNGRIPTILEAPIPPEAMMYLINAVYFKGSWTKQFDPDHTRDDTFTARSGAEQSVRMMQREGSIRHYADEQMEMVDLPYGWDRYCMAVVLPRGERSLAQVTEQLAGNWNGVLEKCTPLEMTLQLPRFTLEYEVGLNDILSAMGMDIAFDPTRADFTGINAAGQLYISRVKHKTFVEVNEEGTEAAAVTSVEVGTTSVPPTFRVDKPFLFLIHERHSGAILFIGQVNDLGS